jgi:hypothetical protein
MLSIINIISFHWFHCLQLCFYVLWYITHYKKIYKSITHVTHLAFFTPLRRRVGTPSCSGCCQSFAVQDVPMSPEPRGATLCHIVPSGCAIRLCHPVVPCFRRFGGWRNQHGVAATSLRLSRRPRVFAQDTRCSWNRMESHLMICKQGYKRKQHQWIIFQNACTEAQWKDLANSSGHESLLVSCPVSIRKWYAAGWDSVCQF